MTRPPILAHAVTGIGTLLLTSFLLAGCLPSSCSETESRALYPADSLSRTIAGSFIPDTLLLTGSFAGGDDVRLEYVRSIAFSPGGLLYAGDAAAGIVVVIGTHGELDRVVESDLFSYPYIIGAGIDSALVFSPGRYRIQVIRDGAAEDIAETPRDLPPKGLLQYAHLLRDTLWLKLLGEDFEGFAAPVYPGSAARPRVTLPGPTWRRAGFLRSWGDTLLSLNGYRPVIDIILPDGRLDSMRLVGFDSPMLSRLRLFELGEIDAPPLLTASAASHNDRLYVLNMRPGWLRIDVYDRSGQLIAVLTEPDPGFDRDYYPTDIAVHGDEESGTIRIGISVVRPEARVDLYEWTEPR